MKIFYILINLFFTVGLFAQNTVGLLSYQPTRAYDGYNLIFPHNQPDVILLNNCGEVIHRWAGEADTRPGNMAYLQEDGRIVKCSRPAAVAGDPIWAGGGGAKVEIRTWDNVLEWDYELNSAEARLHHDIAVLPDGNILMLAWESKTEEEAIQAGRNPDLLAQDVLWPDYIFEVDPTTDEIVWEWHTWDHLIQDFDPSKDNYGVVGDHPELIDINWDTSDGHPDWMHSNSIDYDPINQQIILSVPTFNEFWIIDHTTTTEQAAGNNGGMGNRGGDLLYRWGNPMTYDAGTEADQQLFYQHDVHIVDDFLENSHPLFGKIALFNNRVGEDFSTANVLTTPFDMYSWSYPLSDGVWGPNDFDQTITHPTPTEMYSTGLSSIQILPNGNTLLCSGRFGYSFELTPENEIVWEYKTPLVAGQPATQGDTLLINNNLTFRIQRYPTTYSAFDNRDLTPQGYLENEPNEEFCNQILPVGELDDFAYFKIYPNPAHKMTVIEWEGARYNTLEIYDMLGRRKFNERVSGGRKYLNLQDWTPGVYFVRLDGGPVRRMIVGE